MVYTPFNVFWFYFCNVDYFLITLPSLPPWMKQQTEGPEAAAVTTGTGAFNVIKDRKFKHRPAWSSSFGPLPFISQPYLHVPSSSSFFKHSRCIRVSISLFVFLISLLWESRGRWRREKKSKRERERALLSIFITGGTWSCHA